MGRNTFRNILIGIILLSSVTLGIKKFNLLGFENPENMKLEKQWKNSRNPSRRRCFF